MAGDHPGQRGARAVGPANYQDLVAEDGAAVSYDSVRRFLKRIGWTRPLPFRRMECEPAQEAQVDFGTGAPVIDLDGKWRKTHVFRIVLSHSRKAYSEATYRQTTDDFLRALENAFEHFGGVPHGTTRKHIGRVFQEVERPALRRLPTERFPNFHEAQRAVNRDGHVEVAKSYYSAPPEYLGRRVWVRWDGRTVRIFNHRFEQIAMHVRREPGRFSTLGEHLAPEKISGVERGATWLLHKAAGIGDHAQAWAEEMLHARGIEGLRVLQGLLALSRQRPDDVVNDACRTALT